MLKTDGTDIDTGEPTHREPPLCEGCAVKLKHSKSVAFNGYTMIVQQQGPEKLRMVAVTGERNQG